MTKKRILTKPHFFRFVIRTALCNKNKGLQSKLQALSKLAPPHGLCARSALRIPHTSGPPPSARRRTAPPRSRLVTQTTIELLISKEKAIKKTRLKAGLFNGSPSWIRTTIPTTRMSCPTVRRRGNNLFIAISSTPLYSQSQQFFAFIKKFFFFPSCQISQKMSNYKKRQIQFV